jgi:hypothetical protein
MLLILGCRRRHFIEIKSGSVSVFVWRGSFSSPEGLVSTDLAVSRSHCSTSALRASKPATSTDRAADFAVSNVNGSQQKHSAAQGDHFSAAVIVLATSARRDAVDQHDRVG